jgi:hypothetical protein
MFVAEIVIEDNISYCLRVFGYSSFLALVLQEEEEGHSNMAPDGRSTAATNLGSHPQVLLLRTPVAAQVVQSTMEQELGTLAKPLLDFYMVVEVVGELVGEQKRQP